MTNAKDSQNTNFSIHKFMISALGLSGTALLVYAYIYSFTSRNMQCFASVERIAEEVGASPASVKRALKSLLEIGYVEKLSQKDFRTNCYVADLKVINRCVQNEPDQSEPSVSSICTGEGIKMSCNNRTIIRTITTTSSTRAERESENEKEISFRRYGDEKLVLLTERQYMHLLKALGSDMLNEYIIKLESYLLTFPGNYVKSHYKTILKWIEEDADI